MEDLSISTQTGEDKIEGTDPNLKFQFPTEQEALEAFAEQAIQEIKDNLDKLPDDTARRAFLEKQIEEAGNGNTYDELKQWLAHQ